MTVKLILDSLHPSWRPVFSPLKEELETILKILEERSEGQTQPQSSDFFRAFSYPFEDVKVIILGQDPYPTPGHAMGLSFSVQPEVKPLPRSLNNIFKELSSDLDVKAPVVGDLSPWSEQGVLLLNRVLSVQSGQAGSDRGLGWQVITTRVLEMLAARKTPLAAVLWGKDAQAAAIHLPGVEIFQAAHPSPLSARRGFFGSRPFSQVNQYLLSQGCEKINWEV